MSEISQEDHDAFMADIASLEDEYGIDLDDDDIQAIAQASLENGWDGQATEAAFHEVAATADDDYYEDEYDEEPEQEPPQALVQDAQIELGRFENKLGRRLTHRELEAGADRMIEQARRYDQISAEDAFNNYAEEGGKVLDLDNGPTESRREDRRAWMLERLQDDRATDQPEDNNREYDLDNREDRHAYYAERLNGTEFEDAEGNDEAA